MTQEAATVFLSGNPGNRVDVSSGQDRGNRSDGLARLIEYRYSRRTYTAGYDKDDNPIEMPINQESVERSSWVGDVVKCMYLTQENRGKQELAGVEEYIDPLAQLGDKMKVLAEPLRLHNLEEVNMLEGLWRTLGGFWPSSGYRRDRIREEGWPVVESSAREFFDEISYWAENGIDAELPSQWMDALGGIACGDPILHNRFITPQRVRKEDEGFEGRAYEHIDEVGKGRNVVVFDSIADFAGKVGKLAEDEVDRSSGNTRLCMQNLAFSSRRLSVLLDLMKIGGYGEVKLERPTCYRRILTPVAVALVENFETQVVDGERESVEIEVVANRLVSAVRRRRIDVFELPDLVRAFRLKDGTDYDGISSPEQLFANGADDCGQAHAKLYWDGIARAAVLLGESPRKIEILKTISDKVMLEFVFQLRKRGIQTSGLEWTEEDYISMGMNGDIKDEHDRRLNELEQTPAKKREGIKDGSVAIEWSTQGAPFHHKEQLLSIMRMSPSELKAAYIVPLDFQGDIVLLARVNRGNPSKQPEEPIEIRHGMVETAMRDVRGEFCLYDPGDVSAPTPQRLQQHEQWFRDRGMSVHFVRYTGADDLRNPEYIRGDERVCSLPHIISLQRDQLVSFYTMISAARQIMDPSKTAVKAPVIIEVPENLDVHSSQIRKYIAGKVANGECSSRIVLTLVPPAIVGEVEEIWGRRGNLVRRS